VRLDPIKPVVFNFVQSVIVKNGDQFMVGNDQEVQRLVRNTLIDCPSNCK